MKFPSKLLKVITMCSHIAPVRVCVCVCVCVCACWFYVLYYSLFIVNEGWRENKYLRGRVRFFHLNLLTFSYFCTNTAFVV